MDEPDDLEDMYFDPDDPNNHINQGLSTLDGVLRAEHQQLKELRDELNNIRAQRQKELDELIRRSEDSENRFQLISAQLLETQRELFRGARSAQVTPPTPSTMNLRDELAPATRRERRRIVQEVQNVLAGSTPPLMHRKDKRTRLREAGLASQASSERDDGYPRQRVERAAPHAAGEPEASDPDESSSDDLVYERPAAPEPDAYTDSTRAWAAEVFKQDPAIRSDDLPVLNRNIKVITPEAYAGDDDVELFTEWIINISRFFRMTRLVDQALDQERVMVLGDLLSKQALQWYEKVKFNTTSGVVGLSNDLLKHADQMVQPLDTYSLWKKFMSALPASTQWHLILIYKLTAENATYNQLLRGREDNPRTDRSATHTGTQNSTRTQDNTRTKSKAPARDHRADPCPDATGSRDRNCRGGITRNTLSNATTLGNGTEHTRQHAPRPAVDESKLECWDCGYIGYKAGNLICKDPKRPFMRCMEDTPDTEQGDTQMPQHEDDMSHGHKPYRTGNHALEGEQYEGDYPHETYEEYPDNADDEDRLPKLLMLRVDSPDDEYAHRYWAVVDGNDLTSLREDKSRQRNVDLLAESEIGTEVPSNATQSLQDELA
ncbi:hypothetical protein BDW22DRAFT_1349181 [Trametopsis cervina]|nr:hypothetical protein BDW22DRAFT_1349181 [Trametopsis cervina]